MLQSTRCSGLATIGAAVLERSAFAFSTAGGEALCEQQMATFPVSAMNLRLFLVDEGLELRWIEI